MLPSSRLRYLEGLRGVAALMVLLAHLRLAFYISLPEDIKLFFQSLWDEPLFYQPLQGVCVFWFNGRIAVQLFWLMSGYVITRQLLVKNNNSYLKLAVIKRYPRLMIPALASALLAYLFMKAGLIANLELAAALGKAFEQHWIGGLYNFEPDLLEVLRYASWNIFFSQNNYNIYNDVLWTIGVELLGSYMCYGLYAVFHRNPYRVGGYLLTAVGLGIWQPWYLPMLLGFWLADIHFNPNKSILNSYIPKLQFEIPSWLWMIGGIAAVILAKADISIYLTIALSLVLFLAVLRLHGLQKLFASSFLDWLGKISFSLYLLNLPIICSLSAWLYLHIPLQEATTAKLCLVIAFTLIILPTLAHLYYKWIDRPSVQLSNWLGRKLLTKK